MLKLRVPLICEARFEISSKMQRILQKDTHSTKRFKTIMSLHDIVIRTAVDVKMSKPYRSQNGVVNESCHIHVWLIDTLAHESIFYLQAHVCRADVNKLPNYNAT